MSGVEVRPRRSTHGAIQLGHGLRGVITQRKGSVLSDLKSLTSTYYLVAVA